MFSTKPPDSLVRWLQLSQRHIDCKGVMAIVKGWAEILTSRCHRNSCFSSVLVTHVAQESSVSSSLPQRKKQSTRVPICWVSDLGVGCSHFSVFLSSPEHGSVGSLWLQRQIIILSGSTLTAKLLCTSVSQKTQGPRYSPSSYFPFSCPQSFTPEKKKKNKH